MSDEDIIVASTSFIVVAGLSNKRKRRNRRSWMTQLFRSRNQYRGGDLLNDLSRQDFGQFQNFCRMSATDFEYILIKIGPTITKKNTTFREAIPIHERLAITLRYLATGDSYTSLMYLFKTSKQLISRIVPEVCTAIIEELLDFVKLPTSEDEWLDVAKVFQEQWNFPQCLGSIDGKHCLLQAPINSGAEYYNYKNAFSIVLMGVVDADYCFLYANIGCQGRISDGGVFRNTALFKELQHNELKLPSDDVLPGRTTKVPYVFVADDAFPLQTHIMKPYVGIQQKGSKERIFNYRLSRARRVVANIFGILSAVFRVLRKPMLLEAKKASIVVTSCVYLHNFLRRNESSRDLYTPSGSLDIELEGRVEEGNWRRDTNTHHSYHSETFLEDLPEMDKLREKSLLRTLKQIQEVCHGKKMQFKKEV